MLYWWSKFVLLGPLLRLFGRPTIEGAENVPEHGGAILASNHLAVADSFFLPLLVPRRITFLAKREYFTQPGFVGRLKKIFFSGVGQVPIDRSGGSAAQGAMATAVRLLREEKLLGIYPEGTRSPDGRLYKGKTGIARMTLEAGVPVIPVAMFGTDRVNPIGSRMWRPRKVRIKVGEPLDFTRYAGMAGDRFIERSMTDEIMYALMELSGQTYVDMYAASVKERAAKAKAADSKGADSKGADSKGADSKGADSKGAGPTAAGSKGVGSEDAGSTAADPAATDATAGDAEAADTAATGTDGPDASRLPGTRAG